MEQNSLLDLKRNIIKDTPKSSNSDVVKQMEKEWPEMTKERTI